MQRPASHLLLLATLAAAAAAQPDNPATKSAQEHRQRALKAEGNAERGKALFHDARTQCAQCHSTDGKGGKTGPDLYAAGDKYSRADLVRSILEPSTNIMMGYATTQIETQAGEKFEGVLKGISDTELLLAGAGSVTQRVARADIKTQQTSRLSLMPEGLHAALSPEEFTDLIVYLESLKQPDAELANAAGTPFDIPALAQPVAVRPFHLPAHRFERPIWFAEHPVHDGVFVVAEQMAAKLWLLDKRGAKEHRVLFSDIRREVFVTDTEGLLGVAFHPRFRANGKFYLMHEVMEEGRRAMIIAERLAQHDLMKDREEPSRRVMKIDVDTEVHHGGGIAFGPDGFLYIGMGDAGPQEDPLGHGQDLSTLAGKLLRIEVDRQDPGRGYAIPADNPFARHSDATVRPEIWAYGLRQAWRFCFDPVNGDLWVGDVGQDRFEEVAIVRGGENHGWNVFEGFELFSTVYRKAGERYIPPVVSFRRKHGASVTGGYVYRAQPRSSFYGVYICGDYESKRLWGVTQKGRRLVAIREIGTSPAKIVSFGQDRQGELYVIGYDDGMIYKLDFAQAKFE